MPAVPGDDDGASLELVLREGVHDSLHEVVQVGTGLPHFNLYVFPRSPKETEGGTPKKSRRQAANNQHPGEGNNKQYLTTKIPSHANITVTLLEARWGVAGSVTSHAHEELVQLPREWLPGRGHDERRSG